MKSIEPLRPREGNVGEHLAEIKAKVNEVAEAVNLLREAFLMIVKQVDELTRR